MSGSGTSTPPTSAAGAKSWSRPLWCSMSTRRSATSTGDGERAEASWASATIRPHYTTHTSPELAGRQLRAGAGGLSMATVWEAAVLAGAGMDDLFVVNTVSHPGKIRMLAELARDHRILVAVDEAANAAAHSAAAVRAGSTLGIMVEVDTGMDRCGVDTAEDAVAVARQVTDLPGLRFEGITGYEGHCSLTFDHDLRHERQRARR